MHVEEFFLEEFGHSLIKNLIKDPSASLHSSSSMSSFSFVESSQKLLTFSKSPPQAGHSLPTSTSQPSWVLGSFPSTTSWKPTLCWIQRYPAHRTNTFPFSIIHSCKAIMMVIIRFALHNVCSLIFVHAGGLLPGYQLCGWRAAAPHEWRTGLWHAEVLHVWPRYQTPVQTWHGLSAGQYTNLSMDQYSILSQCEWSHFCVMQWKNLLNFFSAR